MSCCGSQSPPPVRSGGCCGGDIPTPETERDSTWFRIAISLALAGQGMVFGLGYNNALRAGEAPAFGSTAYLAIHGGLFLSVVVVTILLGGPLMRHFLVALRARRITVESLFLLSAAGALGGSVISSVTGRGDVYYEIVAIVLCVYTVGKQLGERNKRRVLAAADAVGEAFDSAYLRLADGTRARVQVHRLAVGDVVEVAPGEAISVDGIIVEGRGYVEQTSVTGEPQPVSREPGDRVLAGSWSVDGVLRVRVQAGRGERVLDGILHTLRQARALPSELQRQADRILAWFVPVVAGVSALTFFGWLFFSSVPWWAALFNAMAVLLVACPCALGLATPMAVWRALQTLALHGFIARSGRFIDALGRADTVVFDKTGTLTDGELAVATELFDPAWQGRTGEVRGVVRALESRAPHHPVARALMDGFADSPEVTVEAVRAVAGRGMEGLADGQVWRVGEQSFVCGQAVAPEWALGKSGEGGVWVSCEGAPVAWFGMKESFREGLAPLCEALRERGLRLIVLTGDRKAPQALPADLEVRTGLLPEEKVRYVRAEVAAGRSVLFLGDGINDAAAMAESNGAIAMGSGASLARATADAIFFGKDFSHLPLAVDQARSVRSQLRGNLLFALIYNGVGMSLAAAGMLHPVVAALLMVGSSALVSARAVRSAKPAEGARPVPRSLPAPPVANPTCP
ncbi:MAG: cation-translocating P-type ATPase [Opitutales bacterium]|nr:cation-translocating P-type ATPase [Opitutales bacterium]